jgi:hypothetical protein
MTQSCSCGANWLVQLVISTDEGIPMQQREEKWQRVACCGVAHEGPPHYRRNQIISVCRGTYHNCNQIWRQKIGWFGRHGTPATVAHCREWVQDESSVQSFAVTASAISISCCVPKENKHRHLIHVMDVDNSSPLGCNL